MGKRGLEAGYEGEEKVESAAKLVTPSYSHSFKILCPDILCSAILGSGGDVIQKIQNDTETKISLAGRMDRYENTTFRLCLIRAHTSEAIDGALIAICEQLKNLIEESTRSETELADIVTRNGDYRVKCIMPKKAAGSMIGTKGSNVNEIREATGIHVIWVEEGTVNEGDLAEQVVSLVGTMDAISACLVRMSVFVQDLSSEQWFSDWSHLRVNGKGVPLPKMQKTAEFDPSSRQQASDNAMVNRALLALPQDVIQNRDFCVRASLPVESMSALIGKGGCTTKDIFQQTGAKVTLKDEDPNTTVSIEGSVQAVLSGYCLIMKKYLEFEQGGKGSKVKETNENGKGSQQAIKAQKEEYTQYERDSKRKVEEYTPRQDGVKSGSKGSSGKSSKGSYGKSSKGTEKSSKGTGKSSKGSEKSSGGVTYYPGKGKGKSKGGRPSASY